MPLLSYNDLYNAIIRLGELATADGEQIDLLIVGGGVMVLEFRSRESTNDLDGVIVNSVGIAKVRRYAANVAAEKCWQADWLNDGAKGFLIGPITPTLLLSSPGINLLRPSLEQLLAMKLCAWRDDVDVSDAKRILSACLPKERNRTWSAVRLFVQPGRELKAKLAFDDLWDSTEEDRNEHT